MTLAVLHIGAGKCGSSALQTTLSQNPVLGDESSSKTRYVAIRHDGPPLHGEALSRHASVAPWGYVASVSAGLLAQLPESRIRELSDQLHQISGSADRILLSNEGWINECRIFEQSGLLARLGLDAEVVAYVRPPVEWLNSAWWQWGAWSGIPIDKWLGNHLAKVRWHELISSWIDQAKVQKVTVRLLTSDVVSDFCDVVQVPRLPGTSSNRGLPGTVLRLYQRHRELRASPHDSAGDFVFAKYLGSLSDDPTPWVMGPYRIRRILEATQESNRRLLELLDDDSRTSMEGDGRWWDEAAYADKKKSSEGPVEPSVRQLEQIAVAALSSIRQLEDENRDLRKRLQAITQHQE